MKIALVTGGTGKIGSGIALHLLKKQYYVVTTFNKSFEKAEQIKNLANNLSDRLTFIQCDLSRTKNIDKLFEQFTAKYSSLDLLINCAAIFSKNKFQNVTDDEFDFVMNLNLKSIYFLIQKFSDLMNENSVIINFSSVGGLIPWKERSLYHISKAGVIALTKSLALELAPKIRVVSIAPGFIESEIESSEKMPLSKIPLQRFGKVENILETIDFIINNNFITGVTIPVDGGRFLI